MIKERFYDHLALLVEWMDDDLDSNVSAVYLKQPLAQDWARVAKVTEEAGEAVDALIGMTGQNPRKGTYGSPTELADELADTALTAMYALQHFTKDRDETMKIVLERARYHKQRREHP